MELLGCRLQNLNRILNHFRVVKNQNYTFTRPCSIAHTLKVKNIINEKRNDALLGGGQKRIDAQHKKVG